MDNQIKNTILSRISIEDSFFTVKFQNILLVSIDVCIEVVVVDCGMEAYIGEA